MATIDRQELDRLERRGLQLTIFSAVFVVVLASGLAIFMYPLVFVHPEGNKWTLRVAFFGFCALTLLFIGYLFDRQRIFNKLKDQLLAELERNVALQVQASADILKSMPDQKYFWDRLTMEFRRALTMEKTMSLVLVKVKPGARASQNDQKAALSDAAKAMSKKLRPTDSIYHLSDDLFGHRAAGDGHIERQANRVAPAGRTATGAGPVRLDVRFDRAQLSRSREELARIGRHREVDAAGDGRVGCSGGSNGGLTKRKSFTRKLAQRLLQIVDEVLRVFQADGHAHGSGLHARTTQFVFVHPVM